MLNVILGVSALKHPSVWLDQLKQINWNARVLFLKILSINSSRIFFSFQSFLEISISRSNPSSSIWLLMLDNVNFYYNIKPEGEHEYTLV
jgi:hypothetical protein